MAYLAQAAFSKPASLHLIILKLRYVTICCEYLIYEGVEHQGEGTIQHHSAHSSLNLLGDKMVVGFVEFLEEGVPAGSRWNESSPLCNKRNTLSFSLFGSSLLHPASPEEHALRA